MQVKNNDKFAAKFLLGILKKAFLYIHLAVLLWGFTGVLGRGITLSAPVLVAYRMLLTCLLVLVAIVWRGRSLRVSSRSFRQLSVIGVLMALHWVAFYASIKMANASVAMVCMSTASIGVSIIEPLLNKRRFDKREIAIGFIALCGVYCIYSFQKLYLWGIVFGVLAALLSALFTILNKRITAHHDARVMIFYEMGTGFLFIAALLPLLFYWEPETVLLPQQINPTLWFTNFWKNIAAPNDWLWLIVLSLCCTLWAQTLALKALRHLSSFTSTLSVNLEPLYGIALAIIIFKENTELHSGFYLGMALILLSVLIQTMMVVRRTQ